MTLNNSKDLDKILELAALRWLHGIDFRNDSKTRGIADREYWAWKTKDFANGTLQAGLAGFLDCHSLLSLDEVQIKKIVSEIILGSLGVQRSNGSFEEAFPFESSYAVTGLVLFYLISARLRYPHYFDAQTEENLNVLALRAYNFLINTPETHGVISNHIATTELALSLYARWKNKPQPPLTVFNFQSDEGWFIEYAGADPGYQTLLEHYFAAAKYSGLESSPFVPNMTKSRNFTKHFMLPNGSYGGEIGARGTSIFYPSALLLAASSNELEWFFKQHLPFNGCVNPLTVDNGNFVPVFNSWALFRKESSTLKKSDSPDTLCIDFPKAALYVRKTAHEVFILSLKNCAWRHQILNNGKWADLSVSTVQHKSQRLLNGKISKINENSIEFEAASAPYSPQRLNNYISAILLRVFAKTFFYAPALLRVFKISLAKYVMREPSEQVAQVKVRVTFGNIIDIETIPSKLQMSRYGFPSHMASANTFEERSL